MTTPSGRYPRNRSSEDSEWMSLAQISDEIGRTRKQTAKLLAKTSWVGVRRQHGRYKNRLAYPAEAVEVLKALLGQPNNSQVPTWLDDHLKGKS